MADVKPPSDLQREPLDHAPEDPTLWSEVPLELLVRYSCVPVRREGERIVLAFASLDGAAVFSPDGRWLAYVCDETGHDEVYVRPFPGPGAKRQVSVGGGTSPVWGNLHRLARSPTRSWRRPAMR